MSLVFFNLQSSSICHNFHYIIITFSIKKVLSVISRFCLFYSCLFQSSRYILINQVDIRVDDMLQKKIKCCLSAPGGCGDAELAITQRVSPPPWRRVATCHVPRAACPSRKWAEVSNTSPPHVAPPQHLHHHHRCCCCCLEKTLIVVVVVTCDWRQFSGAALPLKTTTSHHWTTIITLVRDTLYLLCTAHL